MAGRVALAGRAVNILPDWAPNLHPLIVHFPIAWLIGAVVVDLASLVRPRETWAETAATSLYTAGAVAALGAYLSGRQAAAGVLTPGMAHPVVLEHWNWGLATTVYFTAVASVHLVVTLRGTRLRLRTRAGVAAAGLAGMLLIFQTAERGARLVYEHGLGVMPRTQPVESRNAGERH